MALSRDEVVIAWRALVDEAVPDESLIQTLRGLPSLAALRRLMMETNGFQVSLPRHLGKMPLNAPDMRVDTEVDPATAASLLDVVRGKWERLGEERPHWSVTGFERHLPENLAANREEFEASGQTDLDLILRVLGRHGPAADRFSHVHDFGCGVGRVTLPLARRFARVTGSDVSERHLAVARGEAARRGAANLRFIRSGLPDFGMTEPFDLWFSHLVLQHNPPPVIALILRRMAALLAPGGLALFQVPTYIRGYRFDARAYLRAPPPDPLAVHALPQPALLALLREAGCDLLEIREDASLWPPSEAVSNVVVVRKRSGSG